MVRFKLVCYLRAATELYHHIVQTFMFRWRIRITKNLRESAREQNPVGTCQLSRSQSYAAPVSAGAKLQMVCY